ncbi:MAG: L,D-transpeptidase family protein [Nitrospiraceae bacterium]|nr:L,D-transpeptidase family protein [Nitrospiraceae bacterium]
MSVLSNSRGHRRPGLPVVAAALLILLAWWPEAAGGDTIVGEDIEYVVRKGDTIELVGARLGVDWRAIAKGNGIDIKSPLKKGQKLRVNTRRIVPLSTDNGILINIPDRTLYLFKEGRLVTVVPVGLGKPPKKGDRNWGTPLGKFTIVRKEKNPSWYVPASIQEEMAETGKEVKTIVPPGPENPLGRYALKTSLQGILIHETIWPSSVYQYRSHGCIRVMPEHMEQLFGKVEINTPGELVYMPVKAVVSDRGRVFLEARRDVYGKVKDLRHEAKVLLERLGMAGRVDWNKVDRVLKEKTGIPEDISS